MVLTLLGGCCKLIYDKLRMKKYIEEAEARKFHLETVRENRNVIQLKTDDIPFGIKALEAGLEVEGIVISRPNTPARYTQSQITLVASDASSTKSRGQGPPSPRFAQGRGSTSSSPAPSVRPMIYQPSPYMQLPFTSPLGGTSVRSSASSLGPTPPITRPPSTEKVTQARSPASDTFVGQEIPWQQSGKSTTTLSDVDTLAKLEGRYSGPIYDHRKSVRRGSSRTPSPPESNLSKSLPSVDENEVSEESSRESDSSLDQSLPNPRYSRPGLLTTHSSPSLPSQIYRPLPESAQGDLSLLHTHRLSHAAEVGQLLPRRRDPNSMNPNGSPTSAPVTQAFHSPAISNPMYALDIAIPNAVLDELQFPAPSYGANSPVKRERRVTSDPVSPVFDGLWVAPLRDGLMDGRNSGRGGAGSSGANTVPEDQILRPSSSETEPPERKPMKSKGKKLQKQKQRSEEQ